MQLSALNQPGNLELDAGVDNAGKVAIDMFQRERIWVYEVF